MAYVDKNRMNKKRTSSSPSASIANKRIEKATRKLNILRSILCEGAKASDTALVYGCKPPYISKLRRAFFSDSDYVKKVVNKIHGI
jgi:hypothetical protein